MRSDQREIKTHLKSNRQNQMKGTAAKKKLQQVANLCSIRCFTVAGLLSGRFSRRRGLAGYAEAPIKTDAKKERRKNSTPCFFFGVSKNESFRGPTDFRGLERRTLHTTTVRSRRHKELETKSQNRRPPPRFSRFYDANSPTLAVRPPAGRFLGFTKNGQI